MSAAHGAVKPANYVQQIYENINMGNINYLIFATYVFNNET
jgi:hypothetical protein